MKKGKDKNRDLYLESKEKFRLCELFFDGLVIFSHP